MSHVEISLADRVPPGQFVAPDGKRLEVSAFCRIHAVSRPTKDSEIHIEIWLPENGWTGRLHQYSLGGTGGAINYAALAGFLNLGSVSATTDDGHSSGGRSGWAYGHPEKIID